MLLLLPFLLIVMGIFCLSWNCDLWESFLNATVFPVLGMKDFLKKKKKKSSENIHLVQKKSTQFMQTSF